MQPQIFYFERQKKNFESKISIWKMIFLSPHPHTPSSKYDDFTKFFTLQPTSYIESMPNTQILKNRTELKMFDCKIILFWEIWVLKKTIYCEKDKTLICTCPNKTQEIQMKQFKKN